MKQTGLALSMTVLMCYSATVAIADPSQPQVAEKNRRAAVPLAADTNPALAQLREIFSAEYGTAKTADAKSRLAKQLMSHATPDQPPASRFVLLGEAVRLAVEAGDVKIALEATEQRIATFDIDQNAAMLDIYQSLSRTASPAAARDLGQSIATLTDEAFRRDQTDILEKAIPLLLNVSRKARDPELMKAASAMKLRLAEKAAVESRIAPLRAKVAESPRDPQLNLELGQLLCFTVGNWDEGLPYLAKGNDPMLAAAATAEVEVGGDLDPHVALVLADRWFEWSQSNKGSFRLAAGGRALGHYLVAKSGVKGLEGIRVAKRIAELEANAGFKGIASPLQDQKVKGTLGNSDPFCRFGTVNNQPYKVQGKEWRKSLYLRPEDNGTSVIKFDLPGKHRRLQGHVGIFEHPTNPQIKKTVSPIIFAVVGDGKLLWKSRALTNRDDIEAFSFDVSGITTLELHTTATGSANFAFAAWLDPELVE